MKFFLKNLLSQEQRKARRHAIAGLVAYYWDGGRPVAHNVRDISLTGLYMFTPDQWYPGTVLQLTLQETDKMNVDSDRWIIVHAKIVRQGSDGVGLVFAPDALKELTKILGEKHHEAT